MENCLDVEAQRRRDFVDVFTENTLDDCSFAGIIETARCVQDLS